MAKKHTYHKAWTPVYKTYPKLLRIIEKIGLHRGRQEYHIGFLREESTPEDFKSYLENQDFEQALLAWKDTGEVLSMRKVHNHKFQYHIRLFIDNEIRGHYEYSSEGNPVGHVMETVFNPEIPFFNELLVDYLA